MTTTQDAKVKTIHFKVDDEHLTTTERCMTPNAILTEAKIDPVTHYLVQLEGKNQISYKGKGSDPIEMNEGMRFVSASTGPTPVS